MMVVLTAVELRLDSVHWTQFGKKPVSALSGTSDGATETVSVKRHM